MPLYLPGDHRVPALVRQWNLEKTELMRRATSVNVDRIAVSAYIFVLSGVQALLLMGGREFMYTAGVFVGINLVRAGWTTLNLLHDRLDGDAAVVLNAINARQNAGQKKSGPDRPVDPVKTGPWGPRP